MIRGLVDIMERAQMTDLEFKEDFGKYDYQVSMNDDSGEIHFCSRGRGRGRHIPREKVLRREGLQGEAGGYEKVLGNIRKAAGIANPCSFLFFFFF